MNITQGHTGRVTVAVIFTIKTLHTEWEQAKVLQNVPLSLLAVVYALAVGVVILTLLEAATRYIRKYPNV